MARPVRLEFPGAIYHVFTRGIAREKIFLDTRDRQRFLSALAKAVERFNILLHAYCLLDNHYHLLIETPEGNLSRAVRHINGVYAQGFNRRHDRTGPVFQGRFKACLVEKDSYLLELCRYIVLNPVRAGLVNDPGDWRWSSYRATAGFSNVPAFLTADWLLSVLGGRTTQEARRRYEAFVYKGIKEGERDLEKKLNEPVLGKKEFIRKIREMMDGKENLKEIPRVQRYAGRPDLTELLRKAKDKEQRNRAIISAYMKHGYSMKEIADHLNLHYATVSRIIKRKEMS